MARRKKTLKPKPESQAGEKTVSLPSAVAKEGGRRFSLVVVSALVFLFALITTTSSLQQSPTVDEPVHLFAGYSYLKWGDFRANPEHPPFAKILAAIPLLGLDVRDPRIGNAYWDSIAQPGPRILRTIKLAGKMLFVDNDPERLLFYARLPLILVGVTLAVFVYRWSKDLFGRAAAIASVAICCFDPNILAHSPLIHTDMSFAAFFFIGVYFFWRTLSCLNWTYLCLASFFFGLTAITKYSALIVFPICALLGALTVFSREPLRCMIGVPRDISGKVKKAAAVIGILAAIALVSYVIIWMIYGFRFEAIPDGELHLQFYQEEPHNPFLRWLIAFLTTYRLFPEAWIFGQLFVLNHASRTAYLLGANSNEGFWLYFPVAFLVKTPVPTLILVIATFLIWFSRREDQRSKLFLIVPIFAYFCFAMLSRMNIGLRHLLPIYPFLFVLVGGTAASLWNSGAWRLKSVPIALGVWYFWSVVSGYPHYLAFFNELSGGSINGHKVLLDSNLDWGQDLKGLKRWMDEQRVRRIQFLYFGYYDAAAPQYYGIDAEYLPGSRIIDHPPLPQSSERPEYIAISATHLYGTLLNSGQKEFVRPFRLVEPVATIGYSIRIYRIDKAIEQLRHAAQVNPNSAEAHHNLGRLLETKEDWGEAAKHYRRALQIDFKYIQAHHHLGNVLTRWGDLEKATNHYQLGLESDPASAEIRDRLGIALAMQGRLAEASQQFRKALEIDPRRADTHFNLGNALAQQGHVDEAIEYFRRATSITPDLLQAHLNLAKILASEGRLEEAAKHFQQALRIEPWLPEAHEAYGRLLALQGKNNEAAKHYEQALLILKSGTQVRTRAEPVFK
jgi:Tfp pilus assembly protein PilF/4-amino-4-deoxy-L-arabinose transferase-like glycosyltransferase